MQSCRIALCMILVMDECCTFSGLTCACDEKDIYVFNERKRSVLILQKDSSSSIDFPDNNFFT